MSSLGSPVNKDAAVIPTTPQPPRNLCPGHGIRDLRHCLAAPSRPDNVRAPAPVRTSATTRDRKMTRVVPVRADQSALDQGKEDLA
jgi:hypothetical protein